MTTPLGWMIRIAYSVWITVLVALTLRFYLVS